MNTKKETNEMLKDKLLKQFIIDAYYEVCDNPCGSQLSTSDEAEKIFRIAAKKWLTQKRQVHCMQTGQEHQCEGTDMLDELLEELTNDR